MSRPANQRGDLPSMDKLRERMAEVAKGLEPEAMKPLGVEIGKILRDGNEYDRKRGVDRFGRALPPIRPLTQVRRTAMGRGRGPRLNPGPGTNPRASRVISQFFTRIRTKGKLAVSWGWTGIGSWLDYHIRGIGQRKADISGPSPKTQAALRKEFRDWLDSVWKRKKRGILRR